MKSLYSTPDRRTSNKVVALALVAGFGAAGITGCKLGGPSAKEYDARTVKEMADARDADKCPVGDDVKFTDVGLEATDAAHGKYEVVGSESHRFEVRMEDTEAAIPGATFIVRGTVEEPCWLAVESYQQTN